MAEFRQIDKMCSEKIIIFRNFKTLALRMKTEAEKALVMLWMLCAISLVASQSSTTNEIVPSSTTPRSKTESSLRQTPSLVELSSLKTSADGTVSSTSTVKPVPPSMVVPSYLSVSATITSYPGNTNSVPVETTPSTSAAKNGEAVNVTCANSRNLTDCKSYTGQDDWALPTPVIIGIACGAAALVLLIVVVIGICCARKKQRLSGSKADLSSYWEDNVTLSYINGHIDVPREYPDEMISLDNDSFLNSLDNMSFTNVWTADNAKHTNF